MATDMSKMFSQCASLTRAPNLDPVVEEVIVPEAAPKPPKVSEKQIKAARKALKAVSEIETKDPNG